MKKTLFVFLLVWWPMLAAAQSGADATHRQPADFGRINRTADLSAATNGDFSTIALSVNRLHGLGRSRRRFRVGYGLRFTAAAGRNTNYRTAPADLAKGPGGYSALGLFKPTLVQNLDTLQLPQTRAYSLNADLHLEYAISHRVEVGFNIDLIGFTAGPDQSGTFIANSPVRSPLSNTPQNARLTAFNALFGDQSDQGSLNTEGYVRYRVGPRLGLRAGLSLIVNEYTTARKLTFDNDRFRSGNSRVLLAVSYHF